MSCHNYDGELLHTRRGASDHWCATTWAHHASFEAAPSAASQAACALQTGCHSIQSSAWHRTILSGRGLSTRRLHRLPPTAIVDRQHVPRRPNKYASRRSFIRRRCRWSETLEPLANLSSPAWSEPWSISTSTRDAFVSGCMTSALSDYLLFRDNSRKVDEHFSLFFVKISRKLRSHFLVIFRENMVHNKIKT